MAAGVDVKMNTVTVAGSFKVKDPGSALTHLIGMLLAITAAGPLLVRASVMPDKTHVISMTIFIISMILLYAASTTYHTLNISDKVNKRLKKMDHMMIFVLIAGTYTPICTIALRGRIGFGLLTLVWGIAIIGIVVKACWIYCPKWFSSILYISMGWVCVLALPQILKTLPAGAFYWLLAGGILYTIGGVIYALKLAIFNSKHKYFGSHEIFHLFVMAGSFCHFMVMFVWVVKMPLGGI